MKIFYIALFFFIFKIHADEKYNRNSFHFYSYSTKTNIGYYTNQHCKTNIDHIVSLKDAFHSGAYDWSLERKKEFANDKENHVPACHRINSSKGSATPKVFLRRSRDKKGLEYKIINFCNYVNIYFKIKQKYNLSFKNNDPDLFNRCSIKLIN
tara:strand:+ start:532 stop:990 length:459 start_codon:yes stop_codon:yes gene_type:complete